MKAETTNDKPLMDLTNFEKTPKAQAKSSQITAVLLSDTNWYPVVPGSFHLYKSTESVPYVQFDTYGFDANQKRRVQVFPATVAGWTTDFGLEEEEIQV